MFLLQIVESLSNYYVRQFRLFIRALLVICGGAFCTFCRVCQEQKHRVHCLLTVKYFLEIEVLECGGNMVDLLKAGA